MIFSGIDGVLQNNRLLSFIKVVRTQLEVFWWQPSNADPEMMMVNQKGVDSA